MNSCARIVLVTTLLLCLPAAAKHTCDERNDYTCSGLRGRGIFYAVLLPHAFLSGLTSAGSGMAIGNGERARGWAVTSIVAGSATSILAGVSIAVDDQEVRTLGGVTLAFGLLAISLGTAAIALEPDTGGTSLTDSWTQGPIPYLDLTPDGATMGITMGF